MLRAEREWFPRFIQLCKNSEIYKNALDRDHLIMYRVVHECKWYKDVVQLVKPAFQTGTQTSYESGIHTSSSGGFIGIKKGQNE